MEDKKRVALYSRYSTSSQDGNYSIEIQVERMEATCKSKGWEVTDKFVDAAYSGSNMERPALQNLLSRLDEFDVIMVYRLDRLSRSQRDTMTLIQDYFLKNDVAFVSVSETLDTTTPFGMAMIGILAVFAELERATITERMRGGIEKRIQAGYRLASGNYMPTGYKKVEDDEVMVIDEIEGKKVQRIFDLYEQYHSITKIQKVLKEEGYVRRKFGTIRQILGNRLYIGEVRYKDNYYPGLHEPIISTEQFERVQVILSRHPKGANAGKVKESLFSGLITCGNCGEAYTTYSYRVENKTKGNYYVRSYICRARRLPSEYDEKCFNETWKNEEIENVFLSQLQMAIATKEISETNTRTTKNYALAIKRLDEKINRLIDLYAEGDIDKKVLDTKINKLNKEKENIVLEQSQEAQNQQQAVTVEEIRESIGNFKTLDFEAKRVIVEKVLNGIVIDGKDIEFEWNLSV
ncbi:recombinase family protein [Lysinibacillus sp. NPDC096418]|uniref:recombinase family protein n=1 Tax=Lysinibacillus sp. NPDC096418 TaxID=3364138 RepID=UPI003805F1E9